MRKSSIYVAAFPFLAICSTSSAVANGDDLERNFIKNNSNSQNKQPNIIVILTDDQRWDSLGIAGNDVIQTPTLDRLAGEGLYARQACVASPISCATRATALTGQYPSNNGVPDFFNEIDLQTTYPYYLQKEGYYTGFVGKWGTQETSLDYFSRCADLFNYWGGCMYQSNYWHDIDCNYVNNNGTTDKHNFFCDCVDNSKDIRKGEMQRGSYDHRNHKHPVHQDTYVIPKKVSDFLDSRDPNKPFCLSISYKSPHGPMTDFDTRYDTLYNGIAMPIRGNVTHEAAAKVPLHIRNSLSGYTNFGKGDAYTARIEDKENINGICHEAWRQYYRLVTGVDDSVKDILKDLESRGLADNTVIVFMGDNGHMSYERGLGGKWLMYEESIRVPFFVYDPRNKVSRQTDEFVLSVDIAPTVLEIAGIKAPSSMDGKSVMDLYKNRVTKHRDACFFEHPYQHGGQIESSEAYKDREWKYIIYRNDDVPKEDIEQLFNLKADPLETTNLANDPNYKDKLIEYRAKFARLSTKIRK